MNEHHAKRPRSRREALCGMARFAALGGIAAFSAAMLARAGRTPADGACPRLAPAACDGCAALARCRLPAAAAARSRGKG